MNIHFIKTPEKREIIKSLQEEFGITDLPYLLIESGKERIRAFSGSLSKEEILKIQDIANVELVGLYILKRENEFRLSFDATHLFSPQIKTNIAELDEKQLHAWIRGNDIELNLPQNIYAIRSRGDFFGCGRSNGNTLFNYVPKDRRLKIK